MVDIFCQFKKGCYVPCDEENQKISYQNHFENRIYRHKITTVGPETEASVIQNNLMHKCFELLADMSPDFITKEHVKFCCKVGIDFRHKDRIAKTPGGKIVAEYRSFSFKELHGKERLIVVNKAFNWMAEETGKTVDELVALAKENMLSR